MQTELSVGSRVVVSHRNGDYLGVITRESKTRWFVTRDAIPGLSKPMEEGFHKKSLKKVGADTWHPCTVYAATSSDITRVSGLRKRGLLAAKFRGVNWYKLSLAKLEAVEAALEGAHEED